MLGFSFAIRDLKNILSIDNAKMFLNWPVKNKNITLPVIIPTITLAASKAIFNYSYQSSLVLTSISFCATIIDQKLPNLKNEIFEKVKIIAKIIYAQYQEVKKQNEDKEKTKKEQLYKSYCDLMISFLKLSNDKMLKDFDLNELCFKNVCIYFNLTNVHFQTLKNIYRLYPDETEDHYQKRFEAFIELLAEDKKRLFQEKLKKD